MANSRLVGSSSPHMHAEYSTSSLMREVIFALIPALIFAVCYFGPRVLLITALGVVSAVGAEYLWEKCLKKPITISDFSAAVTGLLLALNLPVSVPWWIPVVGSFFAIIVAKQFFGGIGKNFVNPALAARCFLLVSFASIMTNFSVDGVSSATPLAILESQDAAQTAPHLLDCFLGVIPGCIGETSKLLLILGGVYLIVRHVIDFRIPVAYIGTVFILSYLFGQNGLYQIMCGGLMLGAFFMATDYATSPVTGKGQLIYGIGCGLITIFIRYFGSYSEGVCYSILVMNLLTALIDKYVKPQRFGVVKSEKKEAASK